MSFSAARPIVLVGAGRMGGALLGGWLDRGIAPEALLVVDPGLGDAARKDIAGRGVRIETSPPADVAAGVLVVAVKPQAIDAVLPGLRPLRREDTVALSIAAGITVARLEHGLGAGPVVRAMPNTPAQIGRGTTVAVANAATDAAARETVTELLAAVGTVDWVEDEALMDAVTAVSGSGPAYVFLLAECLAAAGREVGLSPPLAERLARGTVAGAGALLAGSELDAETLRRNVTSPGGTTEAALGVLMDETRGLRPLMIDAVKRAAARSRELGA